MNPAHSRRRPRVYARLALLALLTVGVLLAATRMSRQLFDRPRAVPEADRAGSSTAASPGLAIPRAEPREPDAEALFRVAGSEGEVEAFREGQWVALPRGEIIGSPDVIRTGAGSRAVLRLGSSTEIELREKVQIRLDRLSKTEMGVDLVRGKVFAHVARAGDHLTISASDTRTSNDGPTHFIVKAEESGRVSVAVTDGSAHFASGGREVILGPGTESRSERGGAPAEPERIPEEVLLSVVWPEAERHGARGMADGKREGVVAGRARPSSAVTVNGAPVLVAADGRFQARVPLRVGANPLEVEAEDLSGRRKTTSTTLDQPPARRPDLTPIPGSLWKK
jgi:FecR protein/Glucodextranase, domain B